MSWISAAMSRNGITAFMVSLFAPAAVLVGSIAIAAVGEDRPEAPARDVEIHRTELESIVPPDQAIERPRQVGSVRELADRLAARLERVPNDPDGWRLLARSYEYLSEPAKARAAAEKAAALQGP